jgi:hypothetical protein
MRLVTAAVATLFLGCAGWGRDHDARLRFDEQDLEPLVVRCEAIPVAGSFLRDVSISVESPGGLQPVGELFDWWRRPADAPSSPMRKRHRLTVDAEAFARTIQGDVERMLGAQSGVAAEGAPRLVVRILDVSTVMPRPGLTALRGRMVSRIVLGAELRDAGRTLWSRVFEGEGEKDVSYVRLVHHEATLAAAYCAALTQLGEAVSDIGRARAAASP